MKTTNETNHLLNEIPAIADVTVPSSAPPSNEAVELFYANLLAQRLPSIRTVDDKWYAYRNGTWREVRRSSIRPLAQRVLPSHLRTEKLATKLLDHLEGRGQTNPDKFRSFHCFDHERNVLLNVANGVVRVNALTGAVELLPHAEAHLFTAQIAASYDPAAACTLYTQVMQECLPDPEDRRLFQLFGGYMLLPDCRFEVALCCYGEGGTGKSTLADPIGETLGAELVQRLSLAHLCDPKGYHLPKLRSAAVNLATELDALEVEDSAQFKSIVTGEALAVREIWGKPMQMKTTAKLWFLANSLPRFKNGTEAEVRRTRFLAFTQKPAQKDVLLRSKLRLERNGILNLLIAGLTEALRLPEMPHGGVHSRTILERFTVNNDPLRSFVEQRCEMSPEVSAPTDRLTSEFAEFCEENGFHFGENSIWFYRHLYQRYPTLRSKRVRYGSEYGRVVVGLRLKNRLELDDDESCAACAA